jgi:hypothetical protein
MLASSLSSPFDQCAIKNNQKIYIYIYIKKSKQKNCNKCKPRGSRFRPRHVGKSPFRSLYHYFDRILWVCCVLQTNFIYMQYIFSKVMTHTPHPTIVHAIVITVAVLYTFTVLPCGESLGVYNPMPMQIVPGPAPTPTQAHVVKTVPSLARLHDDSDDTSSLIQVSQLPPPTQAVPSQAGGAGGGYILPDTYSMEPVPASSGMTEYTFPKVRVF